MSIKEKDLRGLVPLAALLAIGAAQGQEGFPLDGTWRGELESGAPVVVAMSWDGERINGMIDPGPRSVPFSAAVLDAATWTVRIEAEGDRSIVIEGKLEDIGSYRRFLEGTWTENGARHPVRLTRE